MGIDPPTTNKFLTIHQVCALTIREVDTHEQETTPTH